MRGCDFKWVSRLILLQLIACGVYAASLKDPCGGPNAIIAIIDRPTVGDSACVAPDRTLVAELGGQYQTLTQHAGSLTNYPQAEFRLGLPKNNELKVISPNIFHQPKIHASGLNATTVGIKHEIGYTTHWLGAVETLITPPSGSRVFGSQGTGAAFNGIVTYAVNATVGITFMGGVTTATQPSLNGGGRYSSFNPDLVVTYALSNTYSLYGEVYGQTKTAVDNGSGFNWDSGLVWQASPHIAFDIEYGHRINGFLGGFGDYVGAGVSLLS